MSWADRAIESLQKDGMAQMRPRGNSMIPLIRSGNLVTLEVCKQEALEKGHIVLVRVNGNVYLHLITAINGDRYQISNNKGHINGWVKYGAIYGRAVKIEP